MTLVSNWKIRHFAASFIFVLVVFTFYASAQRVAVVVPVPNETADVAAAKFAEGLSSEFKLLDAGMSAAAFSSFNYETPFNLTREQARNSASAIGCDFMILLRGETFRRSSFKLKDYVESLAVIYVVDARTGDLISWKLLNGEEKTASDSMAALLQDLDSEADAVTREIRKFYGSGERSDETGFTEFSSFENERSAKPPLPYKRISPKYTALAFLYGAEATIDIRLDIDSAGKISSIKFERWAGFGLEESVENAVREMNWRPASRSGKNVPARILLRYNFKKPASEQKQAAIP